MNGKNQLLSQTSHKLVVIWVNGNVHSTTFVDETGRHNDVRKWKIYSKRKWMSIWNMIISFSFFFYWMHFSHRACQLNHHFPLTPPNKVVLPKLSFILLWLREERRIIELWRLWLNHIKCDYPWSLSERERDCSYGKDKHDAVWWMLWLMPYSIF